MTKRLISLLLALVMCLSLCACGGENAENETEADTLSKTKEKLLAEAIEVTTADIVNAAFENIARAKQDYCNQTLKLTGIIREIKEDHIVLGYGGDYVTDVYLPVEDIVSLKHYQNITVVGITTDEIIEEEPEMMMFYPTYHFQMPGAYLVSDTVEVTVECNGDIVLPEGSNIYCDIIWASPSDASQYEGKTCVISAKFILDPTTNLSGDYYDATVVKVVE